MKLELVLYGLGKAEYMELVQSLKSLNSDYLCGFEFVSEDEGEESLAEELNEEADLS